MGLAIFPYTHSVRIDHDHAVVEHVVRLFVEADWQHHVQLLGQLREGVDEAATARQDYPMIQS